MTPSQIILYKQAQFLVQAGRDLFEPGLVPRIERHVQGKHQAQTDALRCPARILHPDFLRELLGLIFEVMERDPALPESTGPGFPLKGSQEGIELQEGVLVILQGRQRVIRLPSHPAVEQHPQGFPNHPLMPDVDIPRALRAGAQVVFPVVDQVVQELPISFPGDPVPLAPVFEDHGLGDQGMEFGGKVMILVAPRVLDDIRGDLPAGVVG